MRLMLMLSSYAYIPSKSLPAFPSFAIPLKDGGWQLAPAYMQDTDSETATSYDIWNLCKTLPSTMSLPYHLLQCEKYTKPYFVPYAEDIVI